jgi:hypothetical protein
MDGETLTRLLRGEHLDMQQRLDSGLWPHPPLPYSSVLQHLVTVLRRERWFPYEWKAAAEGQPIDEQPCIEQREPGLFIGHAQSSRANKPFVVAHTTEIRFDSVEEAAQRYLRWALNPPGDLDR